MLVLPFTNNLGDKQPAENDGKTLSGLMSFVYVSFKTMGFYQEIFGELNWSKPAIFYFLFFVPILWHKKPSTIQR